ncbi:hypothetical protein DESUT3_35870 [Desulfuromonas versatilis]|uniref:Response regulatory domain-containing protein n=1 Tax=Desulfuromonas versatilis TaxID=2802975 RepID=A0ABM8I073_9BACT|nr:response regulator [Desulfuromonas versatilis]BCR06518.1 hypothetical protein DESUT3_35870 [Desulfuromonas versatilis]
MQPPQGATPKPGKGPYISILCVEDEPTTREFLSKIIAIKFPAQTIHTAENGQAGLEMFRKTRAKIVLTDISMPIMDGIQMAREIRRLEPDAYIVALSAHSRAEYPAQELEALFARYMLKPVKTRQLCEAIDEGIARSRVEPPQM